MDNLQISYKPVNSLQPQQRNPRTHSKKQIRQIADSIKEFGFVSPVLIDGEGCQIASNCEPVFASNSDPLSVEVRQATEGPARAA